MKNSSIDADNILESTKIDETQQSKSFSKTPRLLRSTISPYDKNICILCQKPGGKLHKAALNETGKKKKKNAWHCKEALWTRLVEYIPNASGVVANDVQYHLICRVHFQRNVSSENDGTIQVIDNI